MIVKAQGLTRSYRMGTSVIQALKDVNLEIQEGTFVSIMGPSGSGKTTLLNLIGLIDYPTSGKIFFKDKDVSNLNGKELRKIRLRNIGFVFQTFNLLHTLTALENVELPMALSKISQKEQKERATRLLEAVGLAYRLQHKPKELSVGEMQRVAIARALANHPLVIMADEPTGELDSKTGTEIINLLLELCKKQKTAVVVATHDKKVAEVADKSYVIQDGRIA